MSIRAIHPVRSLVPPSDVVARVRAAPTGADLRITHGLIAPFVADGSARFPLAALFGDRDAVATVDYLRAVAPCMPQYREDASSSDAVTAFSFLKAIGDWLVQIMVLNDALVAKSGRMWMTEQELRFMQRGSVAYYDGIDNNALSFHCDTVWLRVLMHVQGDGTKFRKCAGHGVEQLGIGELLFMSGSHRWNAPSTYHAAPRTEGTRAFAVFGFQAEYSRIGY